VYDGKIMMGLSAKLWWAKRFIGVSTLLFTAASFAAAHAQDAPHPVIPDTIQQRIASCTACHGVHGEGTPESGFFPRLAGKPAGYLARQLKDFQDGLRKYGPMEYTVRQLSPEYMHEIAEYFSAQSVPYSRSPMPRLSADTIKRGEELVTHGDPSRKIPACSACHGSQLTGVQPDIPGLVGLPYDYISSQLGSWRTKTRATVAPDCMAEIANRLSESDISAVSAWLAGRELPADMHAQPAGSVTPPLHCGVLGDKGDGA
jgi:cytochrome c553